MVGLGYVGLPLAVTFGQKYQTIGFDIKKEAIENYQKKIDFNGEVDEAGFAAARHLHFTTEAKDLHVHKPWGQVSTSDKSQGALHPLYEFF